MSRIEGVKNLSDEFQRRAKQAAEANVSVLVGYAGQIDGKPSYAKYVHENVEMKWRGKPRKSGIGVYWGPHGQAKFLEAPFRRLTPELKSMIKTAVQRGASMLQALLIAGNRLQRESQDVVPVEYGNLRASAFTRPEAR